MKKYDVKVDITFSKSIYVNAETEDEAKKLAEDEAYSHHHGSLFYYRVLQKTLHNQGSLLDDQN